MAWPLVGIIAVGFGVLGAVAERLASVWPPDEASRRAPGPRMLLLAVLAAAAGGAVAWRSSQPAWVTGAYLVVLAPMIVLVATDLEQRRLPHVVLDPVIVLSLAFVPFNPAVDPVSALLGAATALAFLGLTGLLVRGGIAAGDLYLVVPIGLLAGWPTVFTALFVGALLSALAGMALLATRRAGLRTYIPFGPFLVAGLVIALVWDPTLLGPIAAVAVI